MPKLTRTFPDFPAALAFVNAVAALAEQANHHPDIHIYYNKVVIESWTHTVNAITEKDHALMKAIVKVAAIRITLLVRMN